MQYGFRSGQVTKPGRVAFRGGNLSSSQAVVLIVEFIPAHVRHRLLNNVRNG